MKMGGSGVIRRSSLGGGGVHPERAEAVTVEVLECAAVHKAHILRFMQFSPARFDRGLRNLVDRVTTVEG